MELRLMIYEAVKYSLLGRTLWMMVGDTGWTRKW